MKNTHHEVNAVIAVYSLDKKLIDVALVDNDKTSSFKIDAIKAAKPIAKSIAALAGLSSYFFEVEVEESWFMVGYSHAQKKTFTRTVMRKK